MSKTWIITGAGRGFGREFAIAALKRGDRVAATAPEHRRARRPRRYLWRRDPAVATGRDRTGQPSALRWPARTSDWAGWTSS